MQCQKNISLKKYTTFKIGGKAECFYKARTKHGLIKAIKWAKKESLPFFILAGGSNLLIPDKGFKGLVIKTENCKLKIKNYKIEVGAGALLGKLVNASANVNLSGLEWAAGIPGTVGGAVQGNAGAFSKTMKDIIREVEVFDIKRNIERKFKNKDCFFGYRTSIFKKNPHLIILACLIGLKKGDKQNIKEEMQEYLKYRDEHHPKKPSAGSIFMNPKGASARELIDVCGLKGKRIGQAQISKVHSNFIVNLNGAKSKDVVKLIDLIKRIIYKKYKIKLKEEIQILK